MGEEIATIKSKEKSLVQIVFSMQIAESLCADYEFFRQLISIEKSHKYPTKRVWVFRRSPAFDEAFEQLKADSIKIREENSDRDKA